MIAVLSKASQLPADSIIHCSALTGQKDKVSEGNNFADRTAKAAIKTWKTPNIEALPLIQNLYSFSEICFTKEIDTWIIKGANRNLTGLWNYLTKYFLYHSLYLIG